MTWPPVTEATLGKHGSLGTGSSLCDPIILDVRPILIPLLQQWKSFDFFDVTQVKLADDDETRAFFESNEISSVCSGSDSLFLGSVDGYVRIVGPSWKIVRSFQAHEDVRISHMRQVEGTSLLVTVAVWDPNHNLDNTTLEG